MEYLGFFWFGCLIVTPIVAASKGRSGFGWFVLAFLFSIFALILVALLPSLKADPLTPTPQTHVRCPECREFVFMDAMKCKHCGTKLIPSQPDSSGAERVGRKLGSIFAKK